MASSLASRFAVAAVAAPALLSIVYFADHKAFWALVVVATVLAMLELFAMAGLDKTDQAVCTVAALAAMSAVYWLHAPSGVPLLTANRPYNGAFLGLFVVVPLGLYFLFRFGDMAKVGGKFSAAILGIFYVGLSMNFLAMIRRDLPQGDHVVVFVLVVTWIGDTGAYFAGRFLGKNKLYPAVSPNKTWEGALGSLGASLAAAIAIKAIWIHTMTWVDVGIITLVGSALGQMGDLVESLLKRSYGVKDSGSILPGHGGLLDRVDAVLFMAPWVYMYYIVKPLVA